MIVFTPRPAEVVCSTSLSADMGVVLGLESLLLRTIPRPEAVDGGTLTGARFAEVFVELERPPLRPFDTTEADNAENGEELSNGGLEEVLNKFDKMTDGAGGEGDKGFDVVGAFPEEEREPRRSC